VKLDPATCRRLLAGARVARLATVGPAGPHIVPIVFALDHARIFSVVDEKPKTTRQLQRLANIAAYPRVSVLADAYHDDWDLLWWVRADAVASVRPEPEALDRALAALRPRYPQYRTSPPSGPVIDMEVQRWSGWAATAAAIAGSN
jgi:PPOX class probable F420-dependent enzyme